MSGGWTPPLGPPRRPDPLRVTLAICAVVITVALLAYLFTATPLCETFGDMWFNPPGKCLPE